MLPVHTSCRQWVTLDESTDTNCLVLLPPLLKLGAELLLTLDIPALRRNCNSRAGGNAYIESSSLSVPVVPVNFLVMEL